MNYVDLDSGRSPLARALTVVSVLWVGAGMVM